MSDVKCFPHQFVIESNDTEYALSNIWIDNLWDRLETGVWPVWHVTYSRCFDTVPFWHGHRFVGFLLRAALLWEPSSAKIANGLTLYISQNPSLLMFHLMYCTALRFWRVCARIVILTLSEGYFVAQHHLETLAITRDYCKSCYAPCNQAEDRPGKRGESANHLLPKILLVKAWDWCPGRCRSLRLMSEQMSIMSPEGPKMPPLCPKAGLVLRPSLRQCKKPGWKECLQEKFTDMRIVKAVAYFVLWESSVYQ